MSGAPDVVVTLQPPASADRVRLLQLPVRPGGNAGAHAAADGSMWRAARWASGPASVQVRRVQDALEVRAWGPGAAQAAAHVPGELGFDDDDTGFAPAGELGRLLRRTGRIRLGRTRRVLDALLRAVLEQKVSGQDAGRAWLGICRAWGEPAPGPVPVPLWVPPAPAELARRAYFEFHPFNVEMKRANTLRHLAAHARTLEALADLPADEAMRRLETFPGVGPWTSAQVALEALGHPDAVPLGDYHLPHLVSFAFTGERVGTDARMLELLAPYAPHRARVVMLLWASDIRVPRRGPRLSIRDFRRH
ncbi:MAG: DNA-3-methyladenine glycosylase 2 family protein [Deltaproteobacteria bacterium]|nr:DNA-3-methyladenine glycosylase 2 family protein [Deltaproteobacteria bacterium]